MLDANGQPAAGAVVQMRLYRDVTGKSTVTGADGTWEIAGLAAGTYAVLADATGAGCATLENVVITGSQTTSQINLTLPAGGAVAGTVTDADTGLAIGSKRNRASRAVAEIGVSSIRRPRLFSAGWATHPPAECRCAFPPGRGSPSRGAF